MLKVKKKNTIDALLWIKKHNLFYKSITLNKRSLNWMEDVDEGNLVSMAKENQGERN